jgi:hypothetical protein
VGRDLITGKERRRLQGHRDFVHSLVFSGDGRVLVSGSMDTTALVWDLTGLRSSGRMPADLSPREREGLWAALAEDDAARANDAVWALTATPGPTVAFLKERVRPVAAPDPQRLAQLLTELDSERFTVRKQAMEALEKWGELAEPALRQKLERSAAGPADPGGPRVAGAPGQETPLKFISHFQAASG